MAGQTASVETWPATAAVRPLDGSAWPLGWRNRGGLCSTGHGQTVRRPAHPRRRRRAPSPRQARPRRSAEAVLRPNGRGGVRPRPAGARRASTWPKGWPTPWPWPHGYPGAPSAWAGQRDSTTSSSPAGWLAQGTVHIWADQHAPGFAAAEILGRMVVGEANTTVSVEHVGVGEDPGAAGAPFAPLDAPTFEALAADLEREGLPAWEAARVASTITN